MVCSSFFFVSFAVLLTQAVCQSFEQTIQPLGLLIVCFFMFVSIFSKLRVSFFPFSGVKVVKNIHDC